MLRVRVDGGSYPRAVHAELQLSPDAESPRRARLFVSERLRAWQRNEWDISAGLVVSELVTNAVLHARTPMRLRLVAGRDSLLIELHDGNSRGPVRRAYSADATTGRGLGLVEALTRSWGVEEEPGGKRVWAEVTAAEWESAGGHAGADQQPVARLRGPDPEAGTATRTRVRVASVA